MQTCLRLATLGSIAMVSMACGNAEPSVSVSQTSAAIVNGMNESGYPAVGSLVRISGGRRSSFCTGTLIAPNWVITAAHCTKSAQLASTSFYIGAQATGSGGTGQAFAAAELIAHPRYDDTNAFALLHDVALVRLRDAVPASVATPYPYNRNALESAVGRSATFVGYGVTSGVAQTGGGAKRRTAVPIDRVDPLTYSLKFEGTGVCFGDSGGPGLLELDGVTKVISVVSTGNGCEGDNCDPCSEAGSNHTRVDVFSDWVANTIGDDFPSCTDAVTRCDCSSACREDGVCDDALCGTKSCNEMIRCIIDDCQDGADGSCAQACAHRGSPEALARLAKFATCWSDQCGTLEGAQEQTCLTQKCAAPKAACEAVAGANLCPKADACRVACAANDTACIAACNATATLEAQAQSAALAQCRTTQCPMLTGAAERSCVQSKCTAAYAACYPPDFCSPLGAACPAGTACLPTVNGKTRCEPTAGGADNSPCVRDAQPAACGDGLRCVAGPKGDVCRPVCSAQKACTTGQCDLTAYPEDPSLGVCTAPATPPATPSDPAPTDPAPGADAGVMMPEMPADQDAGEDTETSTDPIQGKPSKGGSKGGCSVSSHADTAPFNILGLGFAMCALAFRSRRAASRKNHAVQARQGS